LLQRAAQPRLALQPCPFLVIGHERRGISRVVLLQRFEDVLTGLLGRRALLLIPIALTVDSDVILFGQLL